MPTNPVAAPDALDRLLAETEGDIAECFCTDHERCVMHRLADAIARLRARPATGEREYKLTFNQCSEDEGDVGGCEGCAGYGPDCSSIHRLRSTLTGAQVNVTGMVRDVLVARLTGDAPCAACAAVGKAWFEKRSKVTPPASWDTALRRTDHTCGRSAPKERE